MIEYNLIYNAKNDHTHSPHDNSMLGIKNLGKIIIQVHWTLVETEKLDDSKKSDDHNYKDLKIIHV